MLCYIQYADKMILVYGKGPKVLHESSVECFYKFETTGRSFTKLAAKSVTATTDAVSVDTLKLLKKS